MPRKYVPLNGHSTVPPIDHTVEPSALSRSEVSSRRAQRAPHYDVTASFLTITMASMQSLKAKNVWDEGVPITNDVCLG